MKTEMSTDACPNSFMSLLGIICIVKLAGKKEICESILFLNINAKILWKILPNETHHCTLDRKICHSQVEFIPEVEGVTL